MSLSESRQLEQKLIDINANNPHLLNTLKTTAKPRTVSYEFVSEYLQYDETSPTLLRWIVDRTGLKGYVHTKAGSPAGFLQENGYSHVKINSIRYPAHRIIYCLFHKKDIPDYMVIDHIDRNRSNNKPSNLLLTTFAKNNKNKSFKDNFNIKVRDNCNVISVRWTDNDGIRRMKSFNYTNQALLVGRDVAFKMCYQHSVNFRDAIEARLKEDGDCTEVVNKYSVSLWKKV